MPSSTTNPFEDLQALFERMNEQFRDATAEWRAESDFEVGTTAVDIVERDAEFVVHIDLPGFTSDDVDVQVTDHTLRVSAERETTTEEADARYVRRERQHARVERSIPLPTSVDADGVDAKLADGVLTVTLPKVEASMARSIEIHSD